MTFMTSVSEQITAAWKESQTMAVLTEFSRLVDVGFESSLLAGLLNAMRVRLRAAQDRSTLIGINRVVVSRFEWWLQNSVIHQRLSMDPDPNITVIDLRRTVVGGLFIKGIDSIVVAFGRYYPHSKVYFLVQRITDDARR